MRMLTPHVIEARRPMHRPLLNERDTDYASQRDMVRASLDRSPDPSHKPFQAHVGRS